MRVVACKKSPLQLFGDEVSRTEYFRGITWANCAPAGFGGAVGAIRRQRACWLRRVDKGGTRGHAAQPVALEGPAEWVCPVGWVSGTESENRPPAAAGQREEAQLTFARASIPRESAHRFLSRQRCVHRCNESPSHTVWALCRLLLLHGVLGQMSAHMSPLKAKILYSLYLYGSPGCRRFGWLLSGFQVLKVAWGWPQKKKKKKLHICEISTNRG